MNTLLFGETPRYASEGLLTGIYSEAFRSTNDIYLERAPKGFEARFNMIRNNRAIYARFFCTHILPKSVPKWNCTQVIQTELQQVNHHLPPNG